MKLNEMKMFFIVAIRDCKVVLLFLRDILLRAMHNNAKLIFKIAYACKKLTCGKLKLKYVSYTVQNTQLHRRSHDIVVRRNTVIMVSLSFFNNKYS